MAIVEITIIEGRAQAIKDALIAKLTDAVVEALGAKPQQVRVVIHEVKDGAYGVAGKPVFLRDAH
jgi:4-oxalocrotonate tautomerase